MAGKWNRFSRGFYLLHAEAARTERMICQGFLSISFWITSSIFLLFESITTHYQCCSALSGRLYLLDTRRFLEYINAVKKFEKVDKQSKQKDISKQPSLSLILNTNHNLNKSIDMLEGYILNTYGGTKDDVRNLVINTCIKIEQKWKQKIKQIN